MKPIAITAKIKSSDVEIEDGGQAMIITVVDEKDNKDNGVFVRLQSWDDTKTHEELKKLIGKKVKIVISSEGKK